MAVRPPHDARLWPRTALRRPLANRHTARDVRRNGDALTFEADAPGDTPNHLVFAVTVRDGALTGTVTQTRDGQVRKARVAFTKQ